MRFFLFAFLLLPACLLSQNTISVLVKNVNSASGHVNVAVYDSDDTFLSFDKVLATETVPANKGSVTLK